MLGGGGSYFYHWFECYWHPGFGNENILNEEACINDKFLKGPHMYFP